MFFKASRFRLFLLIVVVFGFLVQACAEEKQELPYSIIGTAELKAMIDSKAEKFLIIDARNPWEYQEVHIPGAISLPASKFEEHANLLPEEKAMKLVFYCNGVKCGKSKKAAKKAIKMGYTNVLVYADGIPVWEEKGLPIIAGPAYEAKIETTKISPQELNALIASNKDDLIIVDVRDESEFAEGHIPGAINIPVASFASRSGELDKNKTIIVYCNSGGRSYNAYRKLMKLAYKKYYQAIFADWKGAGLMVGK